MFKITKALAAYAAENLGLEKSLTEDIVKNESAIRSHVVKALEAGQVDLAKLADLTKDAPADDANTKAKQVVGEAVSEAVAPLAKGLADLTDALTKALIKPEAPKADPAATPASPEGDSAGAKAYVAAAENAGKNADEDRVRVKSIVERFDRSTKAATRIALDGTEEMVKISGEKGFSDRYIDLPSQFDKHLVNAYTKFMIAYEADRTGNPVPNFAKMNEQDRALVKYAINEMPMVGGVDVRDDEPAFTAKEANLPGYWAKKLSDYLDNGSKALLDDGTSGGLEAVPIVFDNQVILTPLLTGQLFPLVDVRTTPRRRVESFAMDNPAGGWGTAEGTAATAYDTTSFISAFDTNVHPYIGVMEVGLDFEADSPVAVANLLQSRYGESMRKDLDDVIATGSGTGRPLGLFNTAGITTLNIANGNSGPWTLSDIERLIYAVPSAFKQEAGNRFVMVGNINNYRLLRAIQVGTADQRRLLGLDHISNQVNKSIGEVSFRENASVANTKLGVFCMNRYVMYRRAGFTVRRETGGKELATKNLALYVFRMRIGGQFNHADAGAIYEDGPT